TECLQHVPGRSRLLRARPRALSSRHARHAARGGHRLSQAGQSRRAERGATRPRRAGTAGLAAGGGFLMAVDRSRLPDLGPERAFTFPEIRRTTLPNGVRVWTVEHRQVPLVAVLALVPAGAACDPVER